MKPQGKTPRPEMPQESLYICLQCADKRGYRIPRIGAVHSLVKHCEYCGIMTFVMDLDDLRPAWEDD